MAAGEMSHNKKPVLSKEEINERNMDLNDLRVLDSFSLSGKSYRNGLFKSILFSAIAIFIFFVPITIEGETDIVFGILYNGAMNITGNAGLWLVTLIIIATAIFSIYGIYFNENSKIGRYFEGDTIFHPIMYTVGAVFTFLYALTATTNYIGPEIIVGSATGGTVIPDITVAVFWIIIVGAVAMPFLLNYGLVDFIGSFMEPLMRPIWKVPGRAAVNALASFVSSSSVGVLITNRLYRQKVYTEKEAVLVATGFSAVSVGFAYMVIGVAGLQDDFIMVYFVSLVMTMIVSALIARIPPFSRKEDVYVDGREQTEDDLDRADAQLSDEGVLKNGMNRAVKKSYTARPLLSELKSGLMDGLQVLPKVITLLAAIGTTAMILAEYTQIFDVIGLAFIPLLELLQVPNAAEIAPSFFVGLAEMFLPVLLIAEDVAVLEPGARFLVASVSISQIIFFAETIVVMIASKLPLKIWELVVVFIERTIIAIIIGSIFMHILY